MRPFWEILQLLYSITGFLRGCFCLAILSINSLSVGFSENVHKFTDLRDLKEKETWLLWPTPTFIEHWRKKHIQRPEPKDFDSVKEALCFSVEFLLTFPT